MQQNEKSYNDKNLLHTQEGAYKPAYKGNPKIAKISSKNLRSVFNDNPAILKDVSRKCRRNRDMKG